jgi:trk system potassium uptake protein TrkA
MKVIIVGCGRVGASLAYHFYIKGYQVAVIDRNAASFDNLPADFHGRTIEGDVLDRNVLHRAEIETAGALAAVTSSDTLNALVAHVARVEYQVSRVIARNYDPGQLPLQQAFEIPVVGSSSWRAQRIEEILSESPLHMVFIDPNADFSVYQLEVPNSWSGRPLPELLPDQKSKTLALTRSGRPLQVSNRTTLEAGDIIYLSADPGEIDALRRRLDHRQEVLK